MKGWGPPLILTQFDLWWGVGLFPAKGWIGFLFSAREKENRVIRAFFCTLGVQKAKKSLKGSLMVPFFELL
jgi:hypothetical protein